MTSPFSAKLIVSVVTLLCLIQFFSFCDAMRMLREENYQWKEMENDDLFKDEKDSETPASPNIGGFPFPFPINFPPFKFPNINIPGFGSGGGLPDFGIPGFGPGAGDNNPFAIPIPGVPGIGTGGVGAVAGDNKPFAIPIPGVPAVAVQPPTSTP